MRVPASGRKRTCLGSHKCFEAEVHSYLTFLDVQPSGAAGSDGGSLSAAGGAELCRALVPASPSSVVMAVHALLDVAVSTVPPALGIVDGKLLPALAQGTAWPWGTWGQATAPAPSPSIPTDTMWEGAVREGAS